MYVCQLDTIPIFTTKKRQKLEVAKRSFCRLDKIISFYIYHIIHTQMINDNTDQFYEGLLKKRIWKSSNLSKYIYNNIHICSQYTYIMECTQF